MRKSHEDRPKIRLLPQNLVNQIAAGEVVERPLSVVKELVENAIDAGASEIVVNIVDGGKNLISIIDNGCGMDKESLEMCVKSHATSKLNSEDLFDVHTFGFRGEALPSIASVSRLSISTCDNDQEEGWKLQMEGHEEPKLSPTVKGRGTTIEVRDLFFATPARLKFLKSEAYESEKCRAIFDDLALSNCDVSFVFSDSGREKARYKSTDSLKTRIEDIFGESFSKNIFEINYSNERFSLRGFIGVPTFNKPSMSHQYFFVNGRLVKDKTFSSALKSAYAGLIPHGRYPVAILQLTMPRGEVDVNVHPAKTEVRFRNGEQVRQFLIEALRETISKHSNRATTDIMDRFYASIMSTPSEGNQAVGENQATKGYQTANASENNISAEQVDFYGHNHLSAIPTGFSTNPDQGKIDDLSMQYSLGAQSSGGYSKGVGNVVKEKRTYRPGFSNFPDDLSMGSMGFPKASEACKRGDNTNYSGISKETNKIPEETNKPVSIMPKASENTEIPAEISLGNALFQLHNTYIIAENGDGIVVVDQHAAAERMMLEELKENLKLNSQNLLLPEEIELSEAKIELLKSHSDLLEKLGVYIEYPSKGSLSNTHAEKSASVKKTAASSIIVTAIPALLETSDVAPLISDVIDELSAFGDAYTLDDKIHLILSTMSCHSSLRAGKKLSISEMNFLLRRMEASKNIAQCCHGRPSYIIISIKDLNNFFERS